MVKYAGGVSLLFPVDHRLHLVGVLVIGDSFVPRPRIPVGESVVDLVNAAGLGVYDPLIAQGIALLLADDVLTFIAVLPGRT